MENQKTGVGGRGRSPASPETALGKIGVVSLFTRAKIEQNGEPSGSDDAELSQVVSGKLAEVKKLFGHNLARIRKSAGYSQLALSVEVDLTHNFINELEQGTKGASFETLTRLSVVLRTPVHQFFEPLEKAPPHDDFQYPDPIDHLMTELHEAIDVWNDKRTK
ncbi:MAG: helix-turn-helix domain-containing protein [Spirochaetaceae bacterium]|jgi:transcriptional regulator with XRE-family HTH domain|nr:helix-turn-helix domain-containing protein [Spirochaetaceae bacterium]